MRIGKQSARRDILNYEITTQRIDLEWQQRLREIETVVRNAVHAGALDSSTAAGIEAAAHDVAAAATDPESQPSRLPKALAILKDLSATAMSAAGLTEAVEKIVHSVTGA